MQPRHNQKLGPKYVGPFPVVSKVGKVAYKLQLPPHVKVHAVFHVSQLKRFRGELPAEPHIPYWFQGTYSRSYPFPEAILSRRIQKKANKAGVQFLVKWLGVPEEEATWEWSESFMQRFPDFQL